MTKKQKTWQEKLDKEYKDMFFAGGWGDSTDFDKEACKDFISNEVIPEVLKSVIPKGETSVYLHYNNGFSTLSLN